MCEKLRKAAAEADGKGRRVEHLEAQLLEALSTGQDREAAADVRLSAARAYLAIYPIPKTLHPITYTLSAARAEPSISQASPWVIHSLHPVVFQSSGMYRYGEEACPMRECSRALMPRTGVTGGALRSVRLPVNLIGSPINYANRMIGSPITSQSTAWSPWC